VNPKVIMKSLSMYLNLQTQQLLGARLYL